MLLTFSPSERRYNGWFPEEHSAFDLCFEKNRYWSPWFSYKKDFEKYCGKGNLEIFNFITY